MLDLDAAEETRFCQLSTRRSRSPIVGPRAALDGYWSKIRVRLAWSAGAAQQHDKKAG